MKAHKHCDPSTRPNQSMAILGHELDNVLNGLLGMARLLRESGLNPEQDRWSRAIEQSGRQMLRLVSAFRADDQVRDQGPPDEPGTTDPLPPGLAHRPLDGIDLLEQAVLSQAPLAARQGNRLLLTVDPELPQVWHGDTCRLRQLLDNLLGNANKFTSGGEILLQAARGPAGAGETDRRLLLAVTDSGPGVEAAAAARIFDAWAQGSERTRLVYGGSGLGLFVCRQAVRAMGGSIALSSPPGGGARFEVGLPGLLQGNGQPPVPLTRILQRLSCRLDLAEPLATSVAGWLIRLGVCRQNPDRREPRLCLRISELPPAVGQPAPILVLAPVDGCGPAGRARRLAAPIVGSSLGPVLLEMALEWLWLRNGRPGSIP